MLRRLRVARRVALAGVARKGLFFPPGMTETLMLEECESNHFHERVAVKSLPRSAFEVIEAEFFFHC